MTLQTFIKKRKHLIWYVKDYDQLSDAVIIEATLNYGNWSDVQKLIDILGIEKVAKIFKKQTSRKRNNYDPITKNYFKLYFNKYAS
ncbi:MAG: hypothetical protein ABIG10_00855 [bacterium]